MDKRHGFAVNGVIVYVLLLISEMGQREVVVSIYLIIALSNSNTFTEHLESSSQSDAKQ